MSSKRKLNGCTTIRCVREAIKKSGLTTQRFFARAMKFERSANHMAEAEKFSAFEKDGHAANSHYSIPASVLALADTILAERRSTTPFYGRVHERHTRPSISASRF